ncbi:Fumarate hydratase class II [Candidatus Sulfobium mesophilum]|uniref:Fumarate hydratase class II n=1 Tax=Candidatus Sulfobium mesophilum TaxID=2016548 RepID=A0A2U3QIS7_9BACT|nr:Fumarate hydratase class II [Candidatus Sulfobium mesophilum]
MTDFRIERDFLGEVRVPADAMYGPQTQRATENFTLSGLRFPRAFIRSLGLIKGCAADVNSELRLLDSGLACVIRQASDEVAAGRWDEHFPLDIFQTGSGTSTNMNANEVVANRASQLLGKEIGSGAVHPNDHVNLGQSSNDVIPTAIHVSAYLETVETLLPALAGLSQALQVRAEELSGLVKTGRTHLMDAMPLTLGQEIGGWVYQVRQSEERIRSALEGLRKLAVGGTAVGTGVNAHPEFGKRMATKLAERTGLPFEETDNHFASQASMDSVAQLSGALKTSASSLLKIANDLRLMNSGPFAGYGEILLPPLQPGSTIMPGKINPVVPEAVSMACVQVMANDVAVTIGNSRGEFELNAMLPLIAHNVLQSIILLGNATRLLAEKAISGFSVNKEGISAVLGHNPILVTALVPLIGYDKAAQIARKAYAERRPIKDVAIEMTGLSAGEIEKLLDPGSMTGQRDKQG